MLLLIGITGSTAVTAVLFVTTGQFARAQTLAAIAGTFGTLILVGITGAYAYGTHRLVQQNRQERHRPIVIKLVGRGIDTILDILSSDGNAFDKRATPTSTPPLPDLKKRTIHDRFIRDLRRRDADLVNQFDEYVAIRRDYIREWVILKNEIRSHLRDKFEFSGGAKPVTGFVKTLISDEFEPDDIQLQNEEDLLSEFIDREATSLTYYILQNSPRPNPAADRYESVSTSQLAGYLFDRHREEFLEIRNDREFADRIETLYEYEKEMKALRAGLVDGLEEIRTAYVREYDLFESELPPSDRGVK